MGGVQPVLIHLLWFVPLLLLILFFASPRFRGDIAQTRVKRLLAAGLEKSRYTVLNDLVIPSGGGTIRIDHLVVSKFGIFVIESEYVRGLISGTEFQDRWKQNHFRRYSQFDNPMHRNYLQQQALERLLHLPSSRFHTIVVLTGHKGFKTGQPEKVIEPEKLIRYMRKKSQPLLSSEQAAEALKAVSDSHHQSHRIQYRNLTLLSLFMVLLGGAYLAFKDEIGQLRIELGQKAEIKASPEDYHADGTARTDVEKWEDSLMCAYSSDTGRCSCYEPGGSMADLELSRCKSLAERGSVLNR